MQLGWYYREGQGVELIGIQMDSGVGVFWGFFRHQSHKGVGVFPGAADSLISI